MDYFPAMSASRLSVLLGIIFMSAAAPWLRADRVEMQNGDRYFGRVLSVSSNTVVLESEVLGKINVPRKQVASLVFGTNTVAPMVATKVAQTSAPTNPPTAASLAALAGTNADLSAVLRNPDLNTNFIRQVREQMLADSPEAAGKYDEMVNDLLSGKMNMDDLRREARSSADQLRELKRDLGSDAGDSIDAYLDVLDNFLAETDTEPTNASPAPQSKMQASHSAALPAPGH
jgi:hypothetical protein